MAHMQRLICYVCDNRFVPRKIVRIFGKENASKCEIAIRRREGFNRAPLQVTPETRIRFNCHQNILREIAVMEANPMCLRLNVLTQTRSSSCFICNAVHNIRRISSESKADIFIQYDIFVPENVRSCEVHLDERGFLLRPLLVGLQFVYRPCVIQGPYLQSFLQGLRTVAQSQV